MQYFYCVKNPQPYFAWSRNKILCGCKVVPFIKLLFVPLEVSFCVILSKVVSVWEKYHTNILITAQSAFSDHAPQPSAMYCYVKTELKNAETLYCKYLYSLSP